MLKKPRAQCLNCGATVKRPSAKYCSNQCQADYQSKQYVEEWKAGNESGLIAGEFISRHIHHYLIEKFGEQCGECGWQERNPFTGKVPLTVHHVDGDWSNNHEENLRLLCPNCHALTENYMNLNKGKGRTYRRKYEPRKENN